MRACPPTDVSSPSGYSFFSVPLVKGFLAAWKPCPPPPPRRSRADGEPSRGFGNGHGGDVSSVPVRDSPPPPPSGPSRPT